MSRSRAAAVSGKTNAAAPASSAERTERRTRATTRPTYARLETPGEEVDGHPTLSPRSRRPCPQFGLVHEAHGEPPDQDLREIGALLPLGAGCRGRAAR